MNGRGVRSFTSAVILLCAAAPRAVRAAPAPAPAAEPNQLAALWEDLGSQDWPKAAAAILKLVDRGDAAVAMLTRKLEVKKVAVDTRRVAKLIKELNADDWRTREKAHKQLAEMGPPIVPLLREALRNKPPTEVRVRLEAIVAELDVRSSTSPAVLRRGRAFAILGRIASARALQAVKALRAKAPEEDRQWIDQVLLNLAERAVPPLLDAAGTKARQRNYADAAGLCGKAVDIAEAADHYATPRIRAMRDCLLARAKGGKIPPAALAELNAGAAAGKALPIESRIGWQFARGENLLGNSQFAVKQVQGVWPTAYGVWGGDMAEVVPARQGITPREGKHMLQFHHGNFRSSGPANGCQVCQVVDVSRFREAIRAGKVRAFASTFFNRVAGNARTDTRMGMSLIAYSGSMAQHFALSQRRASIATRGAGITADAKPETWEKTAVSMPLPKETSFLVIQLLAAEDMFNDLKGVEFDGHYADSTFVTLVVETPRPKRSGK